MAEMTIKASVNNLDQVLAFVDTELEKLECSIKAQMQIDVAVEELFVNIASYAYGEGSGRVRIRVEAFGDHAVITLTDSGVAYDPLAKEDPDTALAAEQRPIGGLGIFMAKKMMDEIRYERKDGCNILTMIKRY